MTGWQEAVLHAIHRLCQRKGSRIFTRQELISEELPRIIEETMSTGATPAQTLSRVLQELRDMQLLEFLDERGTYRLR